MMFQEGSTARAIIDILARALSFELYRADIAAETNKSMDSIRSALYRLKKKGVVTNTGDGYWKLIRVFRKIRHTKRIVETRQAKKHREWNCDCEATSEGFVPYFPYASNSKYEFPDPPNIPVDNLTTKYARIINPPLKTEMLNILSKQGILLSEELTYVEPTCSPRFFSTPQFCIEGTEWLDELSGIYNPVHEVTVIFVNEQERMYEWTGRFTMHMEEFA